jgi:predicted solute-binding protein
MRIGTVPYLNARPLVTHLACDIVALPPRLLTEAVMNGDVDVALVPTYGIIKNDLRALPQAGLIGCDGKVKSVGFFLRDGLLSPKDIGSLYRDCESQTSVELANVLLTELYGRNPKSIHDVPAARCREADAQLLIGDKALFFQEDGYSYWDLGELWKNLTGCGFMFACWASKRELSIEEIATLTAAKTSGLASIDALIADVPPQRREMAQRYLAERVVYEATETVLSGYELFKTHVVGRDRAVQTLSGAPFPEFEDKLAGGMD